MGPIHQFDLSRSTAPGIAPLSPMSIETPRAHGADPALRVLAYLRGLSLQLDHPAPRLGANDRLVRATLLGPLRLHHGRLGYGPSGGRLHRGLRQGDLRQREGTWAALKHSKLVLFTVD